MRLPLLPLATLMLVTSCVTKPGDGNTDNGSQPLQERPLIDNTTVSNYDTVRFYVVINDTYSYVASEDEAAGLVANEELKKGTILTGGGAAWIEDYNDELYCYSWRADEWYFHKKDVEVMEYLTLGSLPTEQLSTPLFFAADNGNTVTLFKLNLDGHKLEISEDFELKDSKGDLYMMQIDNNAPEFMEVRNDSVLLTHPYLAVTREALMFDGCDDMIFDYKLTEDGVVSAFYDPDFMTNADYCPAEDALLVYGVLYRRVKMPAGIDLKALGLKGKVKRMEESSSGEYWMIYDFDEQGNLTSVTNNVNDDTYTISHHCIPIEKEAKEVGIELTINSNDAVTRDQLLVNLTTNRLHSLYGSDGAEGYLLQCVYDANDQLTSYSATYTSPDDEEEPQPIILPISITETDAQGNWTTRKISETTQTRKIIYY